jgi:cytoplasmic iron level regulating protein YaaA (DUF328/UPF0246 family)
MMLTIISPAKKLDSSALSESHNFTQPLLLEHSEQLLKDLRLLSPKDICSLMGLSDKLGALNYERFQEWHTPFSSDNAKQAILAFKGDVYQGLDAENMNADELNWAQDNLRILSGLYGLLRPLDLMQPYRLEMGTKFANKRGTNLYQFWGDIITNQLNKLLSSSPKSVLINLASNEYFKSVQVKNLDAEIITPVFMDQKGDKFKIISFFAKRARGLMSAFIIKNKITDAQQLKTFNVDGYSFNAAMSEGNKWVFCRPES